MTFACSTPLLALPAFLLNVPEIDWTSSKVARDLRARADAARRSASTQWMSGLFRERCNPVQNLVLNPVRGCGERVLDKVLDKVL